MVPSLLLGPSLREEMILLIKSLSFPFTTVGVFLFALGSSVPTSFFTHDLCWYFEFQPYFTKD